MKLKHYILIALFLLAQAQFAQTTSGCDDCDSLYQPSAPFIKADYKLYKNESCNLAAYTDSKEAKEQFCRASYYYSIQNYYNTIEESKHAYIKASTPRLKFQVLKLLQQSYQSLGDKEQAEFYQQKVNAVLQKFPEFQK